ncbi:hypothetical protein ESCO_003859 [Escovopsis weberi]|uniref:Uncharacterized protein n=1 Tax=Escovopsis weberi TaxID=150374 RepID=A0A0M8MZZ3_ESCWE|nr:hypothetical protein ESCO_003859 [Escovopsis weberi]
MSESGGTPSKLSPSPHIVETSSRASKDDSALATAAASSSSRSHAHPPVTPRRPSFTRGGLGLQTHDPSRQFTPPGPSSAASSSHAAIRPTPTPLSPKLDHSQIYASPTTLLPRRSRGLDFSRAATSLHHSILAEQPSPGSSPLVGGWAMNIPGRQGDCGGPEQSSTSLWSMMGNQERINMSNSLGSNHGAASDMSSSSDDDDLMDEDADGAFVTTPQVSKTAASGQGPSGAPLDSPARSAFPSFSQRQRHRKVPKKKSRGGPLGLGLGFNLSTATYSPTNSSVAAAAAARARRESISWQANQLHISSGGETDEPGRHASDADGHNGDSRSVVRRVVTRRGNLLPKSKNFARIRAALAEECSPAEADFMREAEIVKQVRESDMDLEPRHSLSGPSEQAPGGTIPTAQSSPNLLSHESPMEDISGGDEAMGMGMGEPALGAPGLGNFKQQVIKNSKGKKFWDTFSESSSMGGAKTPPPPPAFPGRGSSSGMSEDATMESPSLQSHATFQPNPHGAPPSAAEITRRINNKRRRDDDFDPSSFKRRAVSPSMSVHGSPVIQSPIQRDSMSFGSRPGSTGGDRGSSAQSEAGSTGGGGGGTPAFPPSGATGQVNRKGRVGLQGMVDTNDGIMRMSIE